MLIEKAIFKINPNASFVIRGTDIEDCIIEFTNGTTPISKADIEAQFTAVEFDMAMSDLRSKRDRLLAASDWTQLPDTTLTNTQKQSWMQYRTELRNITDGLTTVEQVKNVDYPDKP